MDICIACNSMDDCKLLQDVAKHLGYQPSKTFGKSSVPYCVFIPNPNEGTYDFVGFRSCRHNQAREVSMSEMLKYLTSAPVKKIYEAKFNVDSLEGNTIQVVCYSNGNVQYGCTFISKEAMEKIIRVLQEVQSK